MTPTPTLVERDTALSELARLLASVRQRGAGTTLLVTGEAGIGKTALLRQFCEQQPPATRVLWGACDALFTPRPLGPIVDIAEVVGGELRDLVEAGSRAHEVAGGLLRELARSASAIVVFDDLQWADQATLDVLRIVAPRLDSVAVLLVASFRDDALPPAHPLRIVLGELATNGRPDRLHLDPLTIAGVQQLAGQAGRDAAGLFRLTDGNPFFLTEVLAAGDERLPLSVRDAVLARAARLEPQARALLDAVAIFPRAAELSLLERLAPDELPAVDQCIANGMLSMDGAAVGFRHELARLAIQDAIPAMRQIELHRAALAIMVSSPSLRPDPARLAHHAEAAQDAVATLRYAREAAEQAAGFGAHREAAAQYARAIRAVGDGQPTVRAELLERASYEAYLTGELDEAIAMAEEALALRRRIGDRVREGDALRSLSRLIRFAGRTAEAAIHGREAIRLLEALPAGHELAMAYNNLAHLAATGEDRAAALEWGGRALGLARELGDTEGVLYALTSIGSVDFQAFLPAGRERLEEVIELASREGLDEHAGRAYLNLVWWATRNRWYQPVDTYLEPGLRYCTERDVDLWRLFFLACEARVALDRDDWPRATSIARRVLGNARTWAVPRIVALVVDGLVAVRSGDRRGLEALDEAFALADPSDELQRIGWVAAALCEAAWLGMADQAQAAAISERALALALERESWWVVGELEGWRRRLGIVALSHGRVPEPWSRMAAGQWREAADAWERLGCGYDGALVRLEAGDESSLRLAHARLLELGAAPAAARAARRLRSGGARSLPRGPRAATRRNPRGLTVREVEVLGLLREGLRDREIAERLVVSPRTVGHHVSSILGKLGVRSRGQAVAEATRLGIATSQNG